MYYIGVPYFRKLPDRTYVLRSRGLVVDDVLDVRPERDMLPRTLRPTWGEGWA